MAIEKLAGSITSVGFESGYRFVIGWWRTSPIGQFADVMCATPDDRTILLASEGVAAYVTSVYRFDEVRFESVTVGCLAGVTRCVLKLAI